MKTDYTKHVGQKFGMLTVVSHLYKLRSNGKHHKIFFYCKCDCGKHKEIAGHHVLSGKTKSCGCLISKQTKNNNEKLVGQTFTKLTVTKFIGTKNRKTLFECLCECGKTIVLSRFQLITADQKSCGCYTNELLRLAASKYDPRISSALAVYRTNYKDGNLSFDDFYELSQLPCAYCHRLPSNKNNRFIQAKAHGRKVSQFSIDGGDFLYSGLDRLNSSLPHDKNNVVPCCWNCNVAKGEKTTEEFQNWLKDVSAFHLFNLTSEQLYEAVSEWKAKNEKAPSSTLEASSELLNQAY